MKTTNPFLVSDSAAVSPTTAMVADGSTRRVMADISRFFSKARVRGEAVEDERSRLARDLHDGVLQALTGVTLQLDAAAKLVATDPDGARTHLAAIGELVAAEQRELLAFIHRLKPSVAKSMASPAELSVTLEKLRERADHLAGLRVHLTVNGHSSFPRSIGDDIYRIVQEGLANIARHAHAQSARVAVTIRFDQIRIAISDDGCGFPIAAPTISPTSPHAIGDRNR